MRKLLLVLVLLASAGCGAASAPSLPLVQRAPLPGGSWMRPGTSGSDLVYVADADGEVTIYDYQTEKLVGVLTDFDLPMGECTDGSGNVYVLDAGEKAIFEYAHGGTKAIKKLSDSPYAPNECAVDRTSGNLAVANLTGRSSGAGNVAIYAHAAGKPKIYSDKNISYFFGCAYAANGDLLTSGSGSSSGYLASFAWLPKNGAKLNDITVRGPRNLSGFCRLNCSIIQA